MFISVPQPLFSLRLIFVVYFETNASSYKHLNRKEMYIYFVIPLTIITAVNPELLLFLLRTKCLLKQDSDERQL